ncbi:DinB family protein [Bacillus sp. AK128]
MNDNEQIREDLIKSVSGFTDQQLNERVDEDNWSIMQNLEHLLLMERLITSSISYQLANENSKPTQPKPIHFTINRSRKVKAPSNLEPSSAFISLTEIVNKLSESRENLIQVVKDVSDEVLENKSFDHPIFGGLSLKQWVEFIGFHEKRHLEQIEEIKQQLKATN